MTFFKKGCGDCQLKIYNCKNHLPRLLSRGGKDISCKGFSPHSFIKYNLYQTNTNTYWIKYLRGIKKPQIKIIEVWCARSRNRTDTALAGNRILSPARLPVPPSGHLESGKFYKIWKMLFLFNVIHFYSCECTPHLSKTI